MSRPTMPLMMRGMRVRFWSAGTPMSMVSMVEPSRMIVVASATAAISPSLWLMMMLVTPSSRRPRMRREQVLGVVVVQRGGGLVEDQQAHVLGERLGDLHELLLAHAELPDRGHGLLAQSDALEQLGGPGVGLVPADHAALGLLVAEEDVLGDRQVGHQGELLVDDHDALGLGVVDGREADGAAAVVDLALVAASRLDAGEHLHERGLAGAVLAADRVDLALVDRQGHVLEGDDAGKSLGDGPHLEDVFGQGALLRAGGSRRRDLARAGTPPVFCCRGRLRAGRTRPAPRCSTRNRP